MRYRCCYRRPGRRNRYRGDAGRYDRNKDPPAIRRPRRSRRAPGRRRTYRPADRACTTPSRTIESRQASSPGPNTPFPLLSRKTTSPSKRITPTATPAAKTVSPPSKTPRTLPVSTQANSPPEIKDPIRVGVKKQNVLQSLAADHVGRGQIGKDRRGRRGRKNLTSRPGLKGATGFVTPGVPQKIPTRRRMNQSKYETLPDPSSTPRPTAPCVVKNPAA